MPKKNDEGRSLMTEAAQRFDNYNLGQRGHKFTYNQIFSLLLDHEKSFDDIGGIIGVTGQAVHQMVQRHFAKFLPERLRTDRARRKNRLALVRQGKLPALEQLIDNSAAGLVAKLAKKAGIPFKRIISQDGNVSKQFLLVGETLVRAKLSKLAGVHHKNTRSYHHFRFTPGCLSPAKVAILMIKQRRKVIPHFFETTELNSAQLYIPWPGTKKKISGAPSKHKFKFEERRNRWDFCIGKEMPLSE